MENIGEHSRERAPMYSDDDLMPLLEKLHSPTYYNFDVHINPTLSLVEKLINRATQTIGVPTKDALLESEIRKSLQNVPSPELIGSLLCQATAEILNGNDAHTVTNGVLKNLRYFLWEQKLMLTVLAFAVTFGDFWLLVRNYANNAVNEPMTADQREPTTANKDAYKIQIEANNDFIKNLFKTTQCLIEIKNLPRIYAQEMFGVEEKCDRLGVYVYWIMRCAIVAATQIIILSSKGLDQYLVGISYPKEFDKLKSLNQELNLKLSDFQYRANNWYKYDFTHSDIVEMMKSVISPDKDLDPLYHGVTKRKDNLDVLNGKTVLLLISGLNISPEDITNLKHVTVDSERHEIVWMPILKHTISGSDDDDVKNQLETLQNSMPWYSIHQPSLIEEAAIEAFRIEWGFKDSPILVVLSPQAKVLNRNAIYMVRIWQNLPVDNLTSEMELQMWDKETWNLKLLVNDIDHIIQEWIRDERYILIYGGDDLDWIFNFIMQAHSVARNLLVPIEMVYVGNSHNKEYYGRNMQDVIMTEQLSHCLPESSREYFWSRINSMIKSKEKVGSNYNPSRKLLQEILKFNNHGEWALLAKGSTIIGQGPGRTAMTALAEIERWMAGFFKW